MHIKRTSFRNTINDYVTSLRTRGVFQGTAIRDRIQERLRGQLLQNGKGDDDDDEEYYYDDDYYDDEDDDDEFYYDDNEYNDEKDQKNEKEQK